MKILKWLKVIVIERRARGQADFYDLNQKRKSNKSEKSKTLKNQ